MNNRTSANDSEGWQSTGGGIEYDRQTDTYRAEYDWSTIAPSIAAIESLASLRGVAPTDIDPLYEYVDPDALDGVFEADSAGPTTSVTFEFETDRVAVYGDGTITIRRTDDGPK